MNKVDLDRFRTLLRTKLIGHPHFGANEYHDTIDSTNNRAKQIVSDTHKNVSADITGMVIVAGQQTAGRGRLGRVWESPPNAGLYMSIVLHSKTRPIHELPLVTIAAGVAVSRAISSTTGVHVGLKWVNDLICHNRKVGGILAETIGSPAPHLVLGIGINVGLESSQLPPELVSKVTSLHEHAGDEIDVTALLAEICNETDIVWSQLEANENQTILDAWKKLSITLGREISAQYADRQIEGLAEDIDDSGALMVRSQSGEFVKLTAGEVQIRTADGRYC